MSYRRLLLGCFVGALVCCTSPLGPQQHAGAAELPAETAARLHAKIEQVMQHLVENPNSKNGLRSAFELIMMSDVLRQPQLSQPIKLRLLLHHTDSLQSRYLVTICKDAAAFRKLLDVALNQQKPPLDVEFSNRYCDAVQLGMRRFGPALLNDATFALRTALAARTGRALALEIACREQLGTVQGDLAGIRDIVFAAKLDAVQKYRRLQEHHANKVARLYQHHIYAQLTAIQRAETSIRLVEIESLIRDHKFAQATLRLEDLLESHTTDQVLFWRAYCLACDPTADRQTLTATADLLKKQYPDSPWTLSAKRLLAVANSLDANLAANVAATERIFNQLRAKDCDQFQVAARVKKSLPIQIRVAAKTKKSYIGFNLLSNGKPVIAYEGSAAGGRAYVTGDEKIHAFQQGGVLPVFQCRLNRDPTGEFSYSFNYQFTSATNGNLGNQLEQFLSSPWLSTTDGLHQLLSQARSKGTLPESPDIRADGSIVYRWLTAKITEPGFDVSELIVDRDGRLSEFRSSLVDLQAIRYGPDDAFELDPIQFPKIATKTSESIDSGIFFRILATATSLFQKKSEQP